MQEPKLYKCTIEGPGAHDVIRWGPPAYDVWWVYEMSASAALNASKLVRFNEEGEILPGEFNGVEILASDDSKEKYCYFEDFANGRCKLTAVNTEDAADVAEMQAEIVDGRLFPSSGGQ